MYRITVYTQDGREVQHMLYAASLRDAIDIAEARWPTAASLHIEAATVQIADAKHAVDRQLDRSTDK